MDRITKEDILSIQAGRHKSWQLPSNAACHSACSMVHYVKRMCMPKTIRNYETRVDYDTKIITISAIAR